MSKTDAIDLSTNIFWIPNPKYVTTLCIKNEFQKLYIYKTYTNIKFSKEFFHFTSYFGYKIFDILSKTAKKVTQV